MKRYLIVGIICFLIGFTVSKTTVKEKVRYVKGETVTERVPVPYPVKETRLSFVPQLFWKTDTIINDKIIIEYDTVKMIDEFLLKREYELIVFDDNRGKFTARPTVQFNTLSGFSYTFTPMTREVRTERKFEPFLMGNWNDKHGIGLGGGAFVRKIGLGYKYNFNNSFDVSLFYKF